MKEKFKKFYNSELYIKIIYGIPALFAGSFSVLVFTILSLNIINNIFFEKEIKYEEMIKEYRYDHKVYHKKDMERMKKIIELLEEINLKTKN